MKFKLVSGFKPTGDQPQAIKQLTQNLKLGSKHQVLLGVTGSGKTFTMANVIKNINKPTLIISHNKTLAGQLYQEFREFFPNNAVCYFVSYYDYYQPEAYVSATDTYIEKEAEINEEIDKLRLSATTNLLTRKDVIVIASVSCIYNLGSPIEYGKFILELRTGMKIDQKAILLRLSDLQYNRNDYAFERGSFRLRGDTIDVLPAYSDNGLRLEMSQNQVLTDLEEFDPLTGDTISKLEATVIYPAKHYMTDPSVHQNAFADIKNDLQKQVDKFKKEGKLIEAQRIEQRTNFDLEMIREVGYVNGIENYSRYFDGRNPGDLPYTLLDYLDQAAINKDWLLFVDESHMTIPQIRGMYNGDRARKETLVNFGFRLPSAFDNRPLKFEEFMRRIHQVVYVSATPNDYEISLAKSTYNSETGVIEQLIRPTGLVDPVISVKTTKKQIEDLIAEIQIRIEKHERVLVTTLTKKMAEDLSEYLKEKGIKVSYLHSDIQTLDRQDILEDFRRGKYDVVVGINLLREGLDLPEVSLVAILDADKEGFLRSKTSLVQTMGRAARHINSKVIMYADKITGSMKDAMSEVERRRKIQLEYNQKHGITPQSIQKSIRARLVEQEQHEKEIQSIDFLLELSKKEVILPDEKEKLVKKLSKEMKTAAKNLDFETATILRDRIKFLKTQ